MLICVSIRSLSASGLKCNVVLSATETTNAHPKCKSHYIVEAFYILVWNFYIPLWRQWDKSIFLIHLIVYTCFSPGGSKQNLKHSPVMLLDRPMCSVMTADQTWARNSHHATADEGRFSPLGKGCFALHIALIKHQLCLRVSHGKISLRTANNSTSNATLLHNIWYEWLFYFHV